MSVVAANSHGDAPVLTQRHGEHLLIITINRFHRRNAFDSRTARALEAVLDAYDDDPDLRCAVITGAGGVFSAGQDLSAVRDEGVAASARRGFFGILQVPPDKPVIAAVEGHALAGGFEICLACDLIVASNTATMGLPEAARSLVAVGGGLFRLPKRIPYHLAMELAITGTAWPAARLHELGLVNRLSEPGQALDVAIDLAQTVIKAGPLAVRASKQILRRAYEWTEAEAWGEQMAFADPVTASADFQEGIDAFTEKRAPRWTGR